MSEPGKHSSRKHHVQRRAERKAILVLVVASVLLSIAAPGLAGASFALISVGPLVDEWVPAVLIVFVVALNALFVAWEASVDRLKPVHVRYVKETNPSRAKRLQHLLDLQPEYVAAANVGSQLMRVMLVFAAFLLADSLVAKISAEAEVPVSFGSVLVTAILVSIPLLLLNIVLGELVPKSFASLQPHILGLRLYRFIRLASIPLGLFGTISVWLAGLIAARFGGKASFMGSSGAEEEIKTLAESAQQTGEIEEEEKELLHSVFEFSDTVAREVMTPRVDMDAMPLNSAPEVLLELIQNSGHSRIPLYEDTDDQIMGIIHAKDLLMAMVTSGNQVSLRALMRPALFVPENKPIQDLLAEMRATRSQMAVVQDEFGGTAGIVTTEDIVEELVGDIIDEYDQEEEAVVQTEAGYLVDGKLHVDDLNSEIGTNLESQEFDTVGGYVFGLFGRQPKPGESITNSGYCFTVTQTDGRRIQRLRVERLAEVDEEEPVPQA